jgi:hypothetical protein
MIQRFAPRPCGFNRNSQILFDFGLADELAEALRS